MNCGYIYLMKRDDGLWKVGYSNNPLARSGSLKHTFGQRLVIDMVWDHPKARLVEAIAHHLLSDHRVDVPESRECYGANRSVVIQAINKAISFLPISASASIDDRMSLLSIWQTVRSDRISHIEIAIGRRMSNSERRAWVEAGGMDDVPLPEITTAKALGCARITVVRKIGRPRDIKKAEKEFKQVIERQNP